MIRTDPSEFTSASWLVGGYSVFCRDLKIALRRRTDTGAVLVFFVLVASLFPLGVGPEPQLLRSMGPGVVWVAALLAGMLSLNRLFADDYQDGTLEQLLLAAVPLPVLVLGKVCAHWLTSGLLLVCASPLIAFAYGLSLQGCSVLALSLLLGTPVLSLVGAIGAALTVGVRAAGVLISLMVLPLVIPVLIFGASAVQDHAAGLDVTGNFLVLGGLFLAAGVLAPLAASAALRISLE